MQDAHEWLDRHRKYWEDSLGRLAELMERQSKNKRRKK
jgi:hypothetical protein